MPANITVTIANGGTDSTAFTVGKMLTALVIQAPATLTGTISLYYSPTSAGTFVPYKVSGVGVTIAASTAEVVVPAMSGFYKIHSNSEEGGARNFIVHQEE